jgi:hypothetical protein
MIAMVVAENTPKRCREKRREMNGKMRGIEVNSEESSDVDSFCNFSRFAANSIHY